MIPEPKSFEMPISVELFPPQEGTLKIVPSPFKCLLTQQ